MKNSVRERVLGQRCRWFEGADVRLMLTEPGCIMGGPFAVCVRDKLASLSAMASLDVRIESVGMRSEASMSKAYATRLAAARAGRVIPIVQHAIAR